MNFEKGHLFHIYNQGNNRQKVFFNRENYLYFLRKIKTYVLPYADILAWCLMPNHFHLMVKVNKVSVGVASSDTDAEKMRTFNDSIGIMLRSYTNAINKKTGRTGKLFREKTKAECITCHDGITPSFHNTNSGTIISITHPEEQYPELCFHYIHQNPVKAKLVKNQTDWEFSSAQDYAGIRNGKLINRDVTSEYIVNLSVGVALSDADAGKHKTLL